MTELVLTALHEQAPHPVARNPNTGFRISSAVSSPRHEHIVLPSSCEQTQHIGSSTTSSPRQGERNPLTTGKKQQPVVKKKTERRSSTVTEPPPTVKEMKESSGFAPLANRSTRGQGIRGRNKNETKTLTWPFYLVCGLTLIAITLIVTLVVLHSLDEQLQEKRLDKFRSLVDLAEGTTLLGVQSAISASRALQGFVTASRRTLPNISDPPSMRMESFAQFHGFAEEIYRGTTGVVSLATLPGGVATQCYPAGTLAIGTDVLNSSQREWMLRTGTTGEMVVEGPHLLILAQFSNNTEYGVSVRIPVFNVSGVHTLENWWGTTNVILSPRIFFADSGLTQRMSDERTRFALFFTDVTEYGNYSRILYGDASTLSNFEMFRNRTMTWWLERADVFSLSVGSSKVWYVALWEDTDGRLLTTESIAVVVVVTVGGTILLLVVLHLILRWVFAEYDGVEHAPKMTPFAYFVVGIHNGEGLWVTHTEGMVRASELFRQRAHKMFAKHHVYAAEEVSQHAFCVSSRSVEAAIHTCFALIESLEEDPIFVSAESSRLNDSDPNAFGLNDSDTAAETEGETENGPADSCCPSWMPFGSNRGKSADKNAARVEVLSVVHWCEEASLEYDYVRGGIRYMGKDVTVTTRLVRHSRPSTVVLSATAAAFARDSMSSGLSPLGPLDVRGFGQMELFTVTDVSSGLLRKVKLRVQTMEEVNPMTVRVGGEFQSTVVKEAPISESDRSLPLTASRPIDLTDAADPIFAAPALGGSSSTGSLLGKNTKNSTLNISREQRQRFEEVFDQQAALLDVSFDSAITYIFLFYRAYTILFRPFAAPERANLGRRLTTAFGVPQGNLMDHLAVRCALRFLMANDGGVQRTGSSTHDTSSNSAADED